jgi:predicted RNA-binding protein
MSDVQISLQYERLIILSRILVTRQVINGFQIRRIDLLDNPPGGTTDIYNTLKLL